MPINKFGEPILDDSVVKIETHTYNPYANTTFGHNDEIRIPIQQQDFYMLPCESFLYVEGRLVIKRRNDESVTTLANNCVAFMFDEIRYELNGVEIDRNRNVSKASTIKNYVSLSYNDSKLMRNAGWDVTSSIPEGYFNYCVPLMLLLGFCEDYIRVVVNARHELILIRARSDNNCIVGNPATEPEIELFKIQWRMPHVTLNEAVKTATQLEKLRYVIFALQTGRKNIMSQNVSVFDACNLTNVKLYLNSEFYPYDIMNLDFTKNRYAVLFDMCTFS
ncbi:uncharacterized protein LOC143896749 [Temnothorax americanus]|uniref:uncharacterized protein LOC143896749 n=1 Tax=Temnothorax americanus TaxID=1964332 RepID=UPI004067CFF2